MELRQQGLVAEQSVQKPFVAAKLNYFLFLSSIEHNINENGCLIFLTDGKKTKKQKKTSVKHIRIRPPPSGERCSVNYRHITMLTPCMHPKPAQKIDFLQNQVRWPRSTVDKVN